MMNVLHWIALSMIWLSVLHDSTYSKICIFPIFIYHEDVGAMWQDTWVTWRDSSLVRKMMKISSSWKDSQMTAIIENSDNNIWHSDVTMNTFLLMISSWKRSLQSDENVIQSWIVTHNTIMLQCYNTVLCYDTTTSDIRVVKWQSEKKASHAMMRKGGTWRRMNLFKGSSGWKL